MSQNPLKKKSTIILFFTLILLVGSIIDSFNKDFSAKASSQDIYYEPIERFGITAPYNFTESQLNLFNVRTVLDWRSDNPTVFSEDIEYIHVLRVGDSAFSSQYDSLTTIVPRNPGEVWIIGNEPDRFCYQDSVSPEVYAVRYYDMAKQIKFLDPTAKLGFGTVVQPTPIRIRYLQRAINKLIELSDNDKTAAMELIDIWSIHAFILNEHPFSWGAGVPVGFYTYTQEDVVAKRIPEECFTGEVYLNDTSDRHEIADFSDTYSVRIFSERIQFFRNWLYEIGEQGKPLWITEYGSLFPPIDPPCYDDDCINFVNVSDLDTSNFMIGTFNYLLSAKNEQTGFPQDEYHLVQRWFWYSLNDYRYKFGGSLLDPDNNFEMTQVGQVFKSYTDSLDYLKTYLPIIIK